MTISYWENLILEKWLKRRHIYESRSGHKVGQHHPSSTSPRENVLKCRFLHVYKLMKFWNKSHTWHDSECNVTNLSLGQCHEATMGWRIV